MTKIDKAVFYVIDICNDNRFGYSQSRRNTWWDKDCSKLVLDALDWAGYNVSDKATYTGNMLKPLLAAGFKNIAHLINPITGSGLIRGDICLRPATWYRGGHTAMMTDAKHIGQAAGDFDGKSGDSSGKELVLANYYNSPFKYFLRPPEEDPVLFAIKVVEDTWTHKTPDKLKSSQTHVVLAKENKILGISEVSADKKMGRIQNQTDLWISIDPAYSGVKRI